MEEEGDRAGRQDPGARRGSRRASWRFRSTWSLGRELAAETEGRELDGVEVPDGWMGLDIGPRTAVEYAAAIGARRHRVLERADGRLRARAVRRRDAGRRRGGGGGAGAPRWSAAATRPRRSHAFGLADRVDWLSTGGGASLELMEGRELPGVEALMDSEASAAGRRPETPDG